MFRTHFGPVYDAASDAGAAAAATAAAAAAAAAGGAATPWYQGKTDIPAEYIGKWQTMGLHDKGADAVAVAMTKSYMEAQKFVGMPPDQIVRWPKDASDEQGWQAIRTRMGVPTDKAQYDEGIKAVKRADGTAVDQTMVDLGRELAASLRLPATDAPALVQGIVAHLDKRAGAELADKTAGIEAARAALAKDWGANVAANKLIASNAAAKLGIDPATVNSLENVVGYDKIMNMFLKLGQMTGEDRFITSGPGGGNGGVLTVEQAKAQINELKSDAGFRTKLLAGDKESTRQWNSLHKIAVGQAA